MTDDRKRKTGGEVDIAVMLDDRAYERGGDKLLTDSAHFIREQSRALAESRAECGRLRDALRELSDRWFDASKSLQSISRPSIAELARAEQYRSCADRLRAALNLEPRND